MKTTCDLIAIIGATAGGKTSVATHLAHRIGGEVIAADSRQVYKGMTIGTGKDLADYTVEGQAIPYHLIDIVDAGYKYNVFEYQHDFFAAYNNISKRGKPAILCGGSGLYVEAVTKGYRLEEVPPNEQLRNELEKKSDEELIQILQKLVSTHNKTDFDSRKRTIRAIEIATHNRQHPQQTSSYPAINTCYFGILFSPEDRRARITQRLHQRLQEGMVEEVKLLLDSGIPSTDLLYYGLEYKFITLYLTGKLGYNEMVKQLNVAIHQFAKRQMTWFRGMERKGTTIHWIEGMLPMEDKLNQILGVLSNI